MAVFIHGVFLDADIWRHQLAELSADRRCIAVDLLTHGESSGPPADLEGAFDTVTQAKMIVAVLDALGVEEVDLVGNDSGGAIAQLVAVGVPGRIRTLTLTNCDTHDNWPPADFVPLVEAARAGALADGVMALATDAGACRAGIAMGFERPEELSDEEVLGWFSGFADKERAESIQAYVAAMDCAVTVAIRDDLAALDVPAVIVWGTGDGFFPLEWAYWLADTLGAKARVVELDGARLFFPLERPADLNAEIRRLWLAE